MGGLLLNLSPDAPRRHRWHPGSCKNNVDMLTMLQQDSCGLTENARPSGDSWPSQSKPVSHGLVLGLPLRLATITSRALVARGAGRCATNRSRSNVDRLSA